MHDSILGTVGSPLVRVDGPSGATVAAKIESKNPGGSAKDRPAVAMVEAAEERGKIEPGDTIVESTSGNTGIGLALVGAAREYDICIVMPASKSPERRAVMRAYGAHLDLVDGDIDDARDRADELCRRHEDCVQMRQFDNPANPQSHYETTGAEIVEQVGDRTVDALVAGVGTGGTVTGAGRRLREAFPEIEIVAVEPAESPVLSEGSAAADANGYQGMGPGFVSPNLDVGILDGVETVDLETAEAACRRLARDEGVLVGQSSGASIVGARRVARRMVEAGTDDPLVVTVFWDSGERYISTGLFEPDDGAAKSGATAASDERGDGAGG